MLGVAFLWYSLFLDVALRMQSRFGQGNSDAYAQSPSPAEGRLKITCEKIARSISSKSQVFYPGSPEYILDISHWANSSSQVPVCTVEPGTPADVASILQQIAEDRAPFAVKGYGHSANPGFSSTTGVHISMTRFNGIVIREGYQTVEVGAGLAWTDVYRYLIPKGFNVVGGRSDGVGVAGVTLGGGYSWKTNQFGLVVDSVTEFHLVSPNGTQMIVNETDKDLWFALKGGLNNYGIVTKFVLKLYPQTDVWGASLRFDGDLAGSAEQALSKFFTRPHDHKAAQSANYIYINGSVSFGISLFYDGPVPPAGLYDELLNLSSTSTTIFKGKFTDFVSSQFLPLYDRVYFDGVPMLRYTEPIMKAFRNEAKFWGESLSQYDDSVLLVYTLEPLEPDFLTHGKPSAFPPNRSLAVLQSNLYLGWTKPSADQFMADAIRHSAASLFEAGIRDGQDLKNAATYVNYALFGTPLKAMYGNHLERLREIRKKYDPDDVMGLAGGWKF